MQKKITMQEIADIVGVSKATISLYVRDNSTKRISAQTKQKIDTAIRKYNYVNKNITDSNSNVVCCIFTNNSAPLTSTFVSEIMGSIQKSLSDKGLALLMLPSIGDSPDEILKNHISQCKNYKSIILFGSRFSSMELITKYINELKTLNLAFVSVNIPKIDIDINQIIFSNKSIINAFSSFVQLGHKRIVIIAGRKEDPENDVIFGLYKDVLSQNNLPFDESLILYADFDFHLAMETFKEYYENQINKPTAVFCFSDTMALGIYEASRSLGLTLPNDLSIIGRNDAVFSPFVIPSLSSIRLNLSKIGEYVITALLSEESDTNPHRKVYIDGDFIGRESLYRNTK